MDRKFYGASFCAFVNVENVAGIAFELHAQGEKLSFVDCMCKSVRGRGLGKLGFGEVGVWGFEGGSLAIWEWVGGGSFPCTVRLYILSGVVTGKFIIRYTYIDQSVMPIIILLTE